MKSFSERFVHRFMTTDIRSLTGTFDDDPASPNQPPTTVHLQRWDEALKEEWKVQKCLQ